MPQNIHQREIESYRVLPPRMRIIYPEGYELSPTDRYLKRVDDLLEQAQPEPCLSPDGTSDLVSLVFQNQAATHAASSLHLAELIVERRLQAERHLAEIQWRLDEVMARKPLRFRGIGAPSDDGKLIEVEKQILDMEKQKREVEGALWRDLLELRKAIVSDRREYRETRNRIGYFAGGYGGSQ